MRKRQKTPDFNQEEKVMLGFVKPTSVANAITRVTMMMVSLGVLSLGLFLVYSALDGARILPEAVSTIRFEYDARRELITLVTGEAAIAWFILMFVTAWRNK